MPLKNVTAEYPPTVLIHGTIDTDVPHEQSALMAEQLKQHGVRHEFISIPGAEHGFAGGDPMAIDAAYAKAFVFVDEYLRRE
jgi:dipeptidyl aminopeptidase/acylaminoacyl peptidase